MLTPRDQALALASARNENRLLDQFPGAVPLDMAAGYEIQDAAIALSKDGAPAGWKVGMIGLPMRLDSERRFIGPFWGPRPEGSVVSAPRGELFAEVELLLQFEPAIFSSAVGPETVEDHILAVHLGLELAGSAVENLARFGPPALTADLGNCVAVILGPELEVASLESCSVILEVDGLAIGAGGPERIEGGVLQAAIEAIDILSRRRTRVTSPFWIATGALTGAHPVDRGQHVRASTDDGVTVTCVIGSS